MKISIQSLLEGARNASGAVAVIDTFRAFTTAAVALANGASRIIMVATVEEALALRSAESGAICMGVANHTTLQNEYTPRTQVSSPLEDHKRGLLVVLSMAAVSAAVSIRAWSHEDCYPVISGPCRCLRNGAGDAPKQSPSLN